MTNMGTPTKMVQYPNCMDWTKKSIFSYTAKISNPTEFEDVLVY